MDNKTTTGKGGFPRSKPVKQIDVYEEKDPSVFSHIPGNREIDPSHVRFLQGEFAEKGNFTQDNPVVITPNGGIFDGQNRIEALKGMGWPIYYIVRAHNVTIEDVRGVNAGQRPWRWYDYATSYAELGNKHYQRFLELYKNLGLNYSILVAYSQEDVVEILTGGSKGMGGSQGNQVFNKGKFEIKNPVEYERRLDNLKKLVTICGHRNYDFAIALLGFMVDPINNYDQARMERQLALHIRRLDTCYVKEEYQEAFWQIYNDKVQPAPYNLERVPPTV